MSNETNATETKAPRKLPQRRYVGSRETLWYILYDISASFNISGSEEVFVSDVAKIRMNYIALVKTINGIWDIINDIFLGGLVDKTRTRWGKFKPFLVLYAGPGTVLSVIYWLMPLLFSAMGMGDFSKFIFYLFLLMFKNLAESLRDIAKTGMLSTITPDIIDRTRLITAANLLSGFLEKTPSQILDILIDLSIRDIIKFKYRSLYVSFGTVTVIASGIMALGFSLITKERVTQSIKSPPLLHSIKMVFRCKPVLLISLSEFLGSFSSVRVSDKYYYLNVLRLSSLTNIVGIPGAFVSPVSYAYVPQLRRRFSTKALWLVSAHLNNFLMIGVFFYRFDQQGIHEAESHDPRADDPGNGLDDDLRTEKGHPDRNVQRVDGLLRVAERFPRRGNGQRVPKSDAQTREHLRQRAAVADPRQTRLRRQCRAGQPERPRELHDFRPGLDHPVLAEPDRYDPEVLLRPQRRKERPHVRRAARTPRARDAHRT